jgi:transcriptional regulator with GAF, ATPase, and Fis domain
MSDHKSNNLKELPAWSKVAELKDSVGFIGESDQIRRILQTVVQVAPADITVLITGESGTGKELVAKAVHQASHRSAKPLVSVNCGAIPEGILESELFGHEKGSFTGAVGSRKGYFEQANHSTIFLDEIGEMPLSTQVKLLRVLEGGEFMRVGGTEMIRVDTRVIAATNKSLEKEVQKGNFRQDLFYRLNVISFEMPPLRKRKDDIPLLAAHFLAAKRERPGWLEVLNVTGVKVFQDTEALTLGTHAVTYNIARRFMIVHDVFVGDRVGPIRYRQCQGTGRNANPELVRCHGCALQVSCFRCDRFCYRMNRELFPPLK